MMSDWKSRLLDLPDFKDHKIFNALRLEMNAPLIPPISNIEIQTLSIGELLQTSGYEVTINDITFAEDGAMNFHGRRVILYIRDVLVDAALPRYHLTNCKKLEEMWKNNKSGRYVVATRHEGNFLINRLIQGAIKSNDEALAPCRFCLDKINWKDYRTASPTKKSDIVNAFQLRNFFDLHSNSIMPLMPIHSDITAPINQYSADFQEVSTQYRELKKWVCEQCNFNLSDNALRRFLHVHHKDGMKNNNSLDNLSALCVVCHSEQPGHSHMKNSSEIIEYRQIKKNNGL